MNKKKMTARYPPLVGLLTCCALAPAAAADAGAFAQRLAARLHTEVGIARAAHGLPPLQWDAALAAVAAAHSADMARRRYFAHASPDGDSFRERYATANYECRIAIGERLYLGAENLARRRRTVRGGRDEVAASWPDTARLAREIVADWMASGGHRRNLLAPQWRREGIGVHATRTELLVTQNFC